MACGVPVIVADSSSLPEVVGDSAALKVPSHDVEAWHAALLTALDDAQWRKQAAETGLQVAQRYTWHNTAAQTVVSYKRALGIQM